MLLLLLLLLLLGMDAFADGWFLADSGRVLPRVFNGGFDRREARARKTLQQVVEAQKVAGRKR